VTREFKVGLFILLGIVVGVFITFSLGDEKRVFDHQTSLNTSFSDVQGLKVGAPVRLAGVDVGMVQSVKFAQTLTDRRIYVRFSVISEGFNRLHDDSEVTIQTKGLLGDKMLILGEGSDDHPKVTPSSVLKGVLPDDVFAHAATLADKAEKILSNLETITSQYADVKIQDDVRGSLAAIRSLLSDAAKSDGFAHRLLTDPKLADNLNQLVVSSGQATGELRASISELHDLLAQAKSGPGLVHGLLYSQEGEDTLAHLSKTSDELQKTLEGIRTGKGLVHQLVYGNDGTNGTANDDIAATFTDLRAIVADMRKGKGTLGALLVDPSLYEDIKSILGNLERNSVLRALVRYTIKQDESGNPVSMSPPSVGSSASASPKPAPSP
jgi:phospholipid/cholesterol/gamma-HCH transport system substrate-binding protein